MLALTIDIVELDAMDVKLEGPVSIMIRIAWSIKRQINAILGGLSGFDLTFFRLRPNKLFPDFI